MAFFILYTLWSVLYVQKLVSISYINLLYKMGNFFFIDGTIEKNCVKTWFVQKYVLGSASFLAFILSIKYLSIFSLSLIKGVHGNYFGYRLRNDILIFMCL